MKLRLGVANYDLAFRFYVHETTASRIIVKWIQLMDVRLILYTVAGKRAHSENYAMVLSNVLWSSGDIHYRLL